MGQGKRQHAVHPHHADLWDKVDAEALKKQYDVLSVYKNGPRGWANDWLELLVGTQRSFDRLEARWMGVVQLPKLENTYDACFEMACSYKP